MMFEFDVKSSKNYILTVNYETRILLSDDVSISDTHIGY